MPKSERAEILADQIGELRTRIAELEAERDRLKAELKEVTKICREHVEALAETENELQARSKALDKAMEVIGRFIPGKEQADNWKKAVKALRAIEAAKGEG